MFKATHIFMVYKVYIIHFMVNLEMVYHCFTSITYNESELELRS